jgi:hypothetical protein
MPLRLLITIAFLVAAFPAHAQTSSAREMFERLGMLATFSIDCSLPPSDSNGYIVYRAMDGARVQRDTMTSQTNRMFVSVAETASHSGMNEITINGSADGKRLSYVLRLDGPRHRVMQWIEDGKQSVVDGVWDARYTMPWVTKCQ